jgi:hypothetical protein
MGPFRIALVIALVLAASAAAYFFWPWRAELPPATVATAPAAVAPGPRFPVPGEPGSLPPMNESDPALVEALARLFGMDTLGRMLNPEGLVRNIVATIDNLPRETVAQRLNPLKPVPGLPATAGREASLTLAPANSARYATYVRLMESVDPAKLAATYQHFYPLFQQAYIELGYPNGYFNDRLVEVIDHLLETPEIPGPILLVQPKVLYEFADPALEERSAGQKAMLRLGRDNAARVKAKLREIRREVSSREASSAAPK